MTHQPVVLDSAARRLRELHQIGRPLLLVNVWDVAGARAVLAAGSPRDCDIERRHGLHPRWIGRQPRPGGRLRPAAADQPPRSTCR